MEFAGNPCCCDLQEVSDEWLCAQIDRAVSDPDFFRNMAVALRDTERINKKAAEELL